MAALWKIKKFLGLKFDLIDAYAEILENHSAQCEPFELLPASKQELKEAILEEAFSPKAIVDHDYTQSLMFTFLSLANFQKGLPRDGLRVYEKMSAAMEKKGGELVDAIYEQGPTLGASSVASEMVMLERRQLASEWQSEFERFAAAYEARIKTLRVEHASR